MAKVLAVMLAAALGLVLSGAATSAALVPMATGATGAVEPIGGPAAHPDKDDPRGLKAILDRLVANGTITQAQADAILKELAATKAPDREGVVALKRILGDLTQLTLDHLGIGKDQLRRDLVAGKSFGAIADATPDKSREGLIGTLVSALTDRVDTALSAGRITQAQADRALATLTEHVTRFVDHEFRPKADRPRESKEPRAPKPPKTTERGG